MKKNILNLLSILTFMFVSVLSFAQDKMNNDMDTKEVPGKMGVEKDKEEKSVMDDQNLNFSDLQSQNNAESMDSPAPTGTAFVINYLSAKEFYILAPLKGNKGIHKHDIFKVSLSGFNKLNVDFTDEEFAEFYNFVFDGFKEPIKYKIVKTNVDKNKGTKEYEVTLFSKKVKNLNQYVKAFLTVKKLPRVYSQNISWRKQNSFYYTSKALENRVHRKSRHVLWLHKKGRKW